MQKIAAEHGKRVAMEPRFKREYNLAGDSKLWKTATQISTEHVVNIQCMFWSLVYDSLLLR
jgi:hypothetical protein